MIVKLGIVGCVGRMGKQLVAAAIADPRVSLAAGIVNGGKSFHIDGVAPEFCYCTDLKQLFDASDVVIDFTNPDCMKQCLDLAKSMRKALVSGTTGHELCDLMRDVASVVPVLWASNMSYGIAVINQLVKSAARTLKGYDIEIYEMHHRYKKDKISGTALTLAEFASRGSGAEIDKEAVRGPKLDGKINFLVSRGGGVPGDHSVVFASDDQVVTIAHRALDRSVFAKGAIEASLWLFEHANNSTDKLKLFSMADVIESSHGRQF